MSTKQRCRREDKTINKMSQRIKQGGKKGTRARTRKGKKVEVAQMEQQAQMLEMTRVM